MKYWTDGVSFFSGENIFDGMEEITKEEYENAIIATSVDIEEVPISISLAQFYSWLQTDMIFDKVKLYIDELPNTEDNILAKNRFYNAQFVERNNLVFEVFKSKLNVTDEYIDNNFIKWSKK